MHQHTHANRIWNRACGEAPLRTREGDRALTDLLQWHGYIMNGGVLHAVELLSASELSNAAAAYGYFGLDAVAYSLSLRERNIEELKRTWRTGKTARCRVSWHHSIGQRTCGLFLNSG